MLWGMPPSTRVWRRSERARTGSIRSQVRSPTVWLCVNSRWACQRSRCWGSSRWGEPLVSSLDLVFSASEWTVRWRRVRWWSFSSTLPDLQEHHYWERNWPSVSIRKPNSSYCSSDCSVGSFCRNGRTLVKWLKMVHVCSYSTQLSHNSYFYSCHFW